ncbi:MAG: DUF6776 family protein [Gammaproteobacteria bacterium]|nr:DUF6776 family protein [Gammaproteobacteria bacterium]
MTRHRLVVRPHRPLRNGLLYTVVGVLMFLSVFGAFQFGQIRAGFDATESGSTIDRQAGQIARLEAANDALRERVALLERSSDIDQEARERLQREFAAKQDEVLELREELAFYRGIVSPEDGEAGLRVQSMRISPTSQSQVFHYRLVLIQAITNDRATSGELKLEVIGERDGREARLDVAELVMDGADTLRYSFKYFQDFEGDFRLPDGFVPQRLELTIDPSARGAETMTRSFGWDVSTG